MNKGNSSIGSKLTGLLLAVLMIVGALVAVGNASAQEAATAEGMEALEPDFPEIKLTEETITDKLGGGDFVGIYNEDRDAMIGVLYGTEENPNNVYLISIYTRYLGTADVYEDGEMIKSDHPIPVRTLFAQRFAGIYEFNDANGDGMFDSSVEEENGTTTVTRETVYKKVNTYTAWERSGVEEVETDDEDRKEWKFSLTASDLKYKHPWGLWNKFNARNDVLEEVTLTFHLYVEKGYATKDDVPVWKVDVTGKDDGNYNVDDTEFAGTRAYSGNTVDASFKYDSAINGWDFDEANDENPSLLWSTQILFANAVSDEVAGWMKSLIEQKQAEGVDPAGQLEYETDSGVQSMDAADAAPETDAIGADTNDGIFSDDRPNIIRKNKLHCADDWQNVGSLTWVSEVDVDGVEKEMFFQVYGARKFMVLDWSRGAAAGFMAVGGFSYPGGDKIFHDPTYSSQVFQLEAGGSGEEPGVNRAPSFGASALIAGTAMAAVIGVAVVGSTRRKKKQD